MDQEPIPKPESAPQKPNMTPEQPRLGPSIIKRTLAKLRQRESITESRPDTEKPPAGSETAGIPDYFNNTFYHTSREVKKANPEIGSTIDVVFDEIDKQSVKEFTTYQSEAFPGTVFTYSKLTLTPELIVKIARENPDAILANPPSVENPTAPENDTAVLFGYFMPPPQGQH